MTKKKEKALWIGELKFTNGELEVSASASVKVIQFVMVDKGEPKLSVTVAQDLVKASKDVMPETIHNLAMAVMGIFSTARGPSAANDIMPVELICEALDRHIAASLESSASREPTVMARLFAETIGLENVQRLLEDLTVEQACDVAEARMRARSPDTAAPWFRQHVMLVWEELEKLAAGEVAS